jgi:hypothetical protein
MRITSKMLQKIAGDTVQERIKTEHSIIAAYLQGTALEENPVLGGTADIDLVFIHDSLINDREIVRLTADVHLDILHHPKTKYENPRDLRIDPWLGFSLFYARPLYDPQHFLDFVQAGVRGMFELPDNLLARVQSQLEAARQTWLDFHNQHYEPGPEQVWRYLTALESVANGLACLSGPPLTERRFLLGFPARAEATGHPGLYPGLLGLLGVSDLDSREMTNWVPLWDEAFEEVCDQATAPRNLHRHRKAYYRKAFGELLTGDQPQAAAWPLMRTWTQAALDLHPGSPQRVAWQNTFEGIRLTGESFEERLAGLDIYLDLADEVFEAWRGERGI